MAQGILVGTSGAVMVGASGGAQATDAEGVCPSCGCGGTDVPACCSLPNRFSYAPANEPATIAIQFSGSYTASSWTYNTGQPPFPTYAVAPSVTATMSFGCLRTNAAPSTGGCVDDAHQVRLYRDETQWYTDPGNNAVATSGSALFSGAADIGSNVNARPGVITKPSPIEAALGASAAASFYSIRQNIAPISGATVSPGFLWSEVVAVLGMSSKMMRYWVAATPGGPTLEADPIVFNVYFDSSGRTAVETQGNNGTTGTATGSMTSAGSLSVSFSFTTPSTNGAFGLKTPSCTLSGTLSATSNRLPCVPPQPIATAEDCAKLNIDHGNMPFGPPAVMPAWMAEEILDEALTF